MTIENYYKKLNDDGYCQVTPQCIKVNQFIRYYNADKDTLPFCVVKEVFNNRFKVGGYKTSRQWYVTFDKIFFTPKDIERRYMKTKK